ncbi:MAG: non-hydrolyzing UDP-N-acetylglucosamine 2-epimerase [Gemmatimonadota bacterium]
MNSRSADRRDERLPSRISTGRLSVLVVVGTRPEAVKLAPVILELRAHADALRTIVVTTAKHREMLAQTLSAFDIEADADLGLISERQSLSDFVSRALVAMSTSFADTQPNVVLVQGDNSTVLAASLAAHYLGIPVGHIEAGIRSGNIREPFPEELNRRLASVVADIHFAPTERCRQNLIAEGVEAARIHVTGNTIADAVARQRRRSSFANRALNALPWEKRRVLVATMHRREHSSEAVVGACRGIAELARVHPDVNVVFPMHPDPRVRDIAREELGKVPRVELVEPLDYGDMIELLRRCEFALTDSAGIQEECAALARPVLILLQSTDRTEVVTSGMGRVIGTRAEVIVEEGSRLLADEEELARMSGGVNPYGDGHAAYRIVQQLLRGVPGRAGGSSRPEGPAPLPPPTAVEPNA